MTTDSTRLIRAACRGDRAAFDELALSTTRQVRFVIGRRVGAEAIEDLLQDTYADAWEHMHTLRDPVTFRSWLYKIAVRHTCKWLERRERNRAALAEFQDAFVESYEVRFDGDYSDTVRKALDDLEPLSRSVVLLRLVKEQSAKEVAASLDMTPAAVDQRLSRARTQLKTSLRSLENRHES